MPASQFLALAWSLLFESRAFLFPPFNLFSKGIESFQVTPPVNMITLSIRTQHEVEVGSLIIQTISEGEERGHNFLCLDGI